MPRPDAFDPDGRSYDGRSSDSRSYDGRAPLPLDQRLDRWVSAGRQLVDGVSGARPGARPASRAGARPAERRPGPAGPGPAGLGRWVEERLDWLLDDGDDWREPWQQEETSPAPRRSAPAAAATTEGPARPRRGLEAISRRVGASSRPSGGSAAPGEDWPDDASFTVPRWQRPAPAPRPLDDLAAPPPPPSAPARPLPRSTRRRG